MHRRLLPALLVLAVTGASSGCSHAAKRASQPAAQVSAAPTETATPSPSAAPKESPPPPGQPTCAPAHLTITDADALILTGEVQEVFVLRTSGRPCQLRGWPAVQLLDATGKQLKVVFTPAFGPATTETLSAGTSASFRISTARSGGCQDAATIVTTLPGTSSALRTATTLSVCGAHARVSPVSRMAVNEGSAG